MEMKNFRTLKDGEKNPDVMHKKWKRSIEVNGSSD
jgi:hypothetical protein